MKISICVFLIFAVSASAQSQFIVAPNDRATQAGNTFVLDPFQTPGTIDNLFTARNFSGPVLINGIAFRLDDASLNQSFDTVIPRVVVKMSTFSGTYDTFRSGGYDLNKGADDKTVFDASIHWITTDLPTSPNPFDLKVQFSNPFLYDPAQGSLLMRFTTVGPFNSGIKGDADAHGDLSIGWLGDKSVGNLVTQFDVTSVPEPSIVWLLLGGSSTVYCLRKK